MLEGSHGGGRARCVPWWSPRRGRLASFLGPSLGAVWVGMTAGAEASQTSLDLYRGAITPRAGQGDRPLGRHCAGVQVRAVRTGGEEGGPYRLVHRGDADTAADHLGRQGDGREEEMGELHTGRHQVRVPDGLQVPEHDEASARGVGAGRVCRGSGGGGKLGILEARGDEAGPGLLRTRWGGPGRRAGRSGAAAKHPVEGRV